MNFPGFFILRKSGYWLALAILLLTGIYGSLKVVLGNFGLDADSSHSLMLWYGVNKHGFIWISDWIFTQDNWLLSLVPFHFLGFLVFGPEPSVVIFFGWTIFFLSAIFSGLIAWRLGAKQSALLVPLLLLNIGNYAHTSGFASYSTSHNITNLFGLLAIWVIIDSFDYPRSIHVALLTVILIAGAVSDPWMVAAYNLPILIVASLSVFRPSLLVSRAAGLKIGLAALISIVAVKTKLFGTLSFLPVMHFMPGNWGVINENAIFLIKDLGGLINMVPIGQSGDFLPSLISISLLASLSVYSLMSKTATEMRLEQSKKVFFAISFLSMGGIVAAFVISDVPAQLYSGRFLLNCLYLFAISFCVVVEIKWPNLDRKMRVAYLTAAILFIASSWASNWTVMRSKSFRLENTVVADIVDFLDTNGLSYGYGPYWGSHANAVTAASNENVIVRPVTFNRANGRVEFGGRAESSNRWYTVDDIPENIEEHFIIVRSDGEECPDVELCLEGVSRQFGPPSRVIVFGDAIIQVWNKRLIGH